MENVLIEYNYFPSISGKLRIIDIYINENFDFKIDIFYHKNPENKPFDDEYYRSLRVQKILEGKLPETIQNNIKKLLSFERFEIKKTYPELTKEEKQQYELNDIGREFYIFYISGEKYSVNVNPWYFNKKLLKTEQELSFLDFHLSILDFIDEKHNSLIRDGN